MKILFFISSFNKGKGGHFYSLKQLTESLGQHDDCIVVNIGFSGVRKLITNKNTKVYEIPFHGLNFLKLYKDLRDICCQEKPDIIHAYDNFVFPIARLSSFFLKKPIVLTKCGGENPKYFFPFNHYLILFSKENKEYFDGLAKFKTSQICLIPNRVRGIERNIEKEEALLNRFPELTNSKNINFFRISRFSKDYHQSILKTISFSKNLTKSGIDNNLILIGVIQDNELFKEIEAITKSFNIFLVTDPHLTNNASSLLHLADVVVATGRGVMEAASLSKIIMTDSSLSDSPVLLSDSNFETLFKTNFSPRGEISSNYEREMQNLIELIGSVQNRGRYSEQINLWFRQYFDMESAIPTYQKLYSEVKYKSPKLVDLFISILQALRKFKKSKISR